MMRKGYMPAAEMKGHCGMQNELIAVVGKSLNINLTLRGQ